ncbi:MAG TPA: hypothetical protein VFV07_03585 [Rhizomicrobium sp.]|nr:hypothetical protein [Rhizomicrobium sp.]
MFFKKTLLVACFAALPLSAAQAYPCNPVTGVLGAAATVAGAAVTIGTAPLVILSGHEPRFADYTCGREYRQARYYGPPPGAYAAPPPAYYYARPHRPRWYWRHGYAPSAAPIPPPPPPPG